MVNVDVSYIVLLYDSRQNLACVASIDNLSGASDGFATALEYKGRVFTRLQHDAFIFWDYLLIDPHEEGAPEIVGLGLYLSGKSRVGRALARSPLMRSSANVKELSAGYFEVTLRAHNTSDSWADGSQLFGNQVYVCGEDCMIMLEDYEPRNYGFPIRVELVTEVTKIGPPAPGK
jgi:hypothetical protein